MNERWTLFRTLDAIKIKSNPLKARRHYSSNDNHQVALLHHLVKIIFLSLHISSRKNASINEPQNPKQWNAILRYVSVQQKTSKYKR